MKDKREGPIRKKADSFGAYLQIAQNIQPRSVLEQVSLSQMPTGEFPGEGVAPEELPSAPETGATPDEQAIELLRIVSERQPIAVAELMRQAPMTFLEFARHLNSLTEIGLLELIPDADDPGMENVRLSALGRQALGNAPLLP